MTVAIPNAKLRTRRTWLLAVLVIWGCGSPLALAMLLAGPVKPLLLIAGAIVYFAGIFAIERFLKRPVPRSGALRADAGGIYLDGKMLEERSKLSYGHVLRVEEQLVLRLMSRSVDAYPIDISVADETQATDLLTALKLDRTVAEYTMRANHSAGAAAKTAAFFSGSLFLAFVSMIATAIVLHRATMGLGALQAALPAALGVLGLGGAVAAAVTRELFVSVGEDGVRLRRPFRGDQFISFRELRNVEHADRDITLHRADGTTVKLHHIHESAEAAADLVARIRSGIAAFEAPSPRTGEAVARNGRSIAEWIAAASRKHERSANYRAAVVPQQELWRIVEDPSAAATERAGAALALRADLDNEGKTRLRVAAGACAEEKLRIALESVVTADDEALAEALEPLEPPQRRLAR